MTASALSLLVGLLFHMRWPFKTKLNQINHSLFIYIQGGREISTIIVTDSYLCYKEPKSRYKLFSYRILIFNELLKFKTSDEWQH